MPKRFPKFGGAADRRRMEGLTARPSGAAVVPTKPYDPGTDPALTQSGDAKFNALYKREYAYTDTPLAILRDKLLPLRNQVINVQRGGTGNPVEARQLADYYTTAEGFVFTLYWRADDGTVVASLLLPVNARTVQVLLKKKAVEMYTSAGVRYELWLNDTAGKANGINGSMPYAPKVKLSPNSLKYQLNQDVKPFIGRSITVEGSPRVRRLRLASYHPSANGFELQLDLLDDQGKVTGQNQYWQSLGSEKLQALIDGKRVPITTSGGEKGAFKLVPLTAPDAAPNTALALAKAKLQLLALAKAKARARAVVSASENIAPIVAGQPDYDLSRTPDAWELPAKWQAAMPASHWGFLQAVHARQRVVGGTETRGRWNPLKQAAADFGIHQMHVVRELIELSTVHLVRTTLLPLRRQPGADFAPFLDRLVTLYNRQFSLGDLKTATTLLNQQYSTPGPLSAILGEWIARKHPQQLAVAYEGAMELPPMPYVLEPTAGNGLLTTRFDPGIVAVNELEATRLEQLRMQPFFQVTGNDAADEGVMKYSWRAEQHNFLGVITNPPFGSTSAQIITHRHGGAYRMTGWEHVIAARAVSRMADNGRAAIIIGGHHQFDQYGKLAGRDFFFFNWLYSLFNEVRVYQLDAHKLYARQGATWPIRVITLDGCGRTGDGLAPRGVKDAPLPLISSFHQLASEMGLILPNA